MADFFETLENDMKKGASDIEKGWHDFTNSFRMAAEDLGADEKEHLEAENALYTWADGDILDYPYWSEEAGEKDKMMRTLATIMMDDDKLVAPCNGVIAAVDENSNTIAIVLDKEVIVAVKVCTGCADFTKDAKILVKQGEFVRVGQTLAEFSSKIHAKSKLLLIRPDDTETLKKLGFKPAAAKGTMEAGTKAIALSR